MSWDKYNEARRKAKESQNKMIKVKDGEKVVLSSSEKKDLKAAARNSKKYKGLFITFVIVAVLALATLPFGNTLQGYVDQIFNNNQTVDANLSNAATVVDNSGLVVHYVDVGQGDCILIDLPDGKNIMIDSGSEAYDAQTKDKVLNYMSNVLIKEGEILDYMILTHPDADHVRYLPDVLDTFEVKTIIRPYVFYAIDKEGGEYVDNPTAAEAAVSDKEIALAAQEGITLTKNGASKSNTKIGSLLFKFYQKVYSETYTSGANPVPASIEFPSIGKTITGSDGAGSNYTLTFYGPVSKHNLYDSWNDYSTVMALEYKDTTIAFTGDAEKILEEDILESTIVLPNVDIMDMGHHGSRGSSTAEFIAALDPEYAIISCGKDNKYGHPHDEALKRYDDYGVDSNRRFCTAESGDIIVGLGFVDPAGSEAKFSIAYSGDKSFSDTRPVKMEWWHVVAGFIIFAGLILLVVVPEIIKAVRKATK